MQDAAGMVWRAAVKLVVTIWRLFEALDSALWRGLRLMANRLGAGAARLARIASRTFVGLIDWLPSRSGRAYSAFSGVVLILALLWIVDELRAAATFKPSATDPSAIVAPIDLNDPILARVDGRYVHLSEVLTAARASGAIGETESLTPAEAFKRDLVNAYIEQRLLARAAAAEGLAREAETARRLTAVRDRILAASYLEQRVAEVVTDDAVRRIYERNADATRLGDVVKCRHIVVATEEEAQEIVDDLQSGADFAEIARTRSLDRVTAPLGGETGYLAREQMTPAFAAAAFATPEGEIAPPFFTEFGWNILQVVDRRRSGVVPFQDVAGGIKDFLRKRTIETTLAKLKEEAEVVIFPVEGEPASAPILREGSGGAPGG
jgi:peptidyl-prolyl cis-trans isomerase C